MPILLALIPGLIPVLVTEVEHVLGADAVQTDKHAWIVGMISELAAVMQKRGLIPQWLTPEIAVIEKLVEEALSAAISKVS